MKHFRYSLSLLLIIALLLNSVSCSKSDDTMPTDGTTITISSEETSGTEISSETIESTESIQTETSESTETSETTEATSTETSHQTEPYSSGNLKKKPSNKLDPIYIDQYCYNNGIENAGTKYQTVNEANSSIEIINGVSFTTKEICITEYKPSKNDYTFSAYDNIYEYLAWPNVYLASTSTAQWGSADMIYSYLKYDPFLTNKMLSDVSVYQQRCDTEEMHSYTEVRAIKFESGVSSQYYYRLITDIMELEEKQLQINVVDYNIAQALGYGGGDLNAEDCRYKRKSGKKKKINYCMASYILPCMPNSEIKGTIAQAIGIYKKDRYILVVTDWIHFDKEDIRNFYENGDTDYPSSKICKELGIPSPFDLIKDDDSIGSLIV